MKEIVLHIGLPKTGTTSLQRFYSECLLNSQIAFNPEIIVKALVEGVKLLDSGSLTVDRRDLLKSVIHNEYECIDCGVIFISLEILSQRLMQFNPVERCQFLKYIFPDAKIITVFRHQPVVLKSLYLQHISQKYLLKQKDVFLPFAKTGSEEESYKRMMQIDIKEWDYAKFITSFRIAFGANFYVFFFEDYSKDLIYLGKNILKVVGLSSHEIEQIAESYKVPRSNTSYHALTIGLLFAIARSRILLSSFYGLNSIHVKTNLDQVNRAIRIFDTTKNEEFVTNLRMPIDRRKYKFGDIFTFGLFSKFNRYSEKFMKVKKYELSTEIDSYLTSESYILNSRLKQLFPDIEIPKCYLDE